MDFLWLKNGTVKTNRSALQEAICKWPAKVGMSLTDSRRKCRSRMVTKRGRIRVVAANVPQKRGLYIADFFTTLIDAKWGWVFLTFCSAFVTSWLFFGTTWWLIVWIRQKLGSDRICVENVNSWTTAFLFSVETQTTIGYGGRQVTAECPEGMVCILLQSLCGLTLSASLLGLIFAKLSRPRTRAETIMFSKNAVVALRDDKMCFMFRVADVRKSQLLDVSIRLHFFGPRKTLEGEKILYFQEELQVCLSHEAEAQELKPFLLLPLTVVHVINEQSPLYNVAGKDLEFADFELVAVLEGVVESTGMVTQAKMSYLPHEILWGHRFCSLSFINQGHSKKCEKRTKFDISQLDMTHEVSCPLCSANEYYEFRQSCSANRSRPESVEHRIWIPMEEYDML